MGEPFAEFIAKRLSEWQPDVVVPIGPTAGRSSGGSSQSIATGCSPKAPIAYTGMDRRTLPADAPGRRRRWLLARTRAAADGVSEGARSGVTAIEAEFEDTGGGIPAEMAGRLFEPFVTTKRDGLGMGMPICRSIADQHGGTLRASNTAAGGATLTLTLPASARHPSPGRARGERGRGSRLILRKSNRRSSTVPT